MDKKKLGKRIKLARVEKDLSQVQLAELIEARQKNISGYETGVTAPSIEVLLKIAKTLDKTVNYFLDE